MRTIALEPPSSSATLNVTVYVPAIAKMCVYVSVTVSGKLPPGLGYGSSPSPSMK